MPKRVFKLPDRISYSKVKKGRMKSDITNGKRCHICCTRLVDNRRKSRNSSKRGFSVNISHSDFDLFLASQILASNKDIFDDETEEHHRFTENSEFKICRKCGGNMKNSFKFKRLIPKKPYSDWLRNIYSNRDLSMRNSDYFSENSGTHLDPHIPEQDSQNSDQPNSSSKLLVSESIRLQNSTFSQNECYFSTGENQDDSETSLILKESSSQESFLSRDDSDDEEFIPLSGYYEIEDSCCVDSGKIESVEVICSEEEIVPYFWRPEKPRVVKMISFESNENNKCSICKSESQRLEKLSLSDIHGILDRDGVYFERWQELLVCDECFCDNGLSDLTKEMLDFFSKKLIKCEKILLGKFSSDYCDAVRVQKRDELNINKQLKCHDRKFKLNFMSDSDLLQFCFHTKAQVIELLNCARNSGLKKGNKLGSDQKIIIFLMFLKLNLSDADLGIFFGVSKSTIQRARSEVQDSLKGSV